MTRPTPLWRSAAAIGLASLALTACGGGDSAAPSTDTPGTTASEDTPAVGPASVGGDCAGKTGDGTLTVGTLLPQTGSLAYLGPPEFAGVELAVRQINDAGGVLDTPVVKFDSDSGDTSTDIASQSVDRLLGQNVDAIVGAASSSVSLTVIDKITGACVVHFSPANTSPTFTSYDDNGLYWRTAPSDVLQGRVLSNVVIEDGNDTVGILALQDAYGEGLAKSVTEGITSGGGEVVETQIYDPKAANYAAEVTGIKSADPAAIVLIGFDESVKVIDELLKQGIGPDVKPLYLVDGNISNTSFLPLPAGAMEGVKGSKPAVSLTAEFQQQLLTVDPTLTDFTYSAEAYDATTLVALAAQASGDDSGPSIAEQLQEVSAGGTACTDFASCKELLVAGEDIDYNGKSGPIEFAEGGDPTKASIGIFTYGADNKYVEADGDFITGEL